MDKDLFKERGRGMEEAYFRQQDAKLIERLHQEAKLEEIASALAEKLQVDNPDLLRRVRELGVTGDSAPAFLLAPLVQVAWARARSPSRSGTRSCGWRGTGGSRSTRRHTPSGAATAQQIRLTEVASVNVVISGSSNVGSLISVAKFPSVNAPSLVTRL